MGSEMCIRDRLHTGPSRILGGREQKKRPLPQKKSAAKVSVFQYAPGPKPVVTKRYNARRRAPYSLLPREYYTCFPAKAQGKIWDLFCLGHFFGVGVNMLHAGFLPISVPIQASHHNTGYFSKKKKTCIPTNYRRICKSYGGDDQI